MTEQISAIPPVIPEPEMIATTSSKNKKLIIGISVLVVLGLLASVVGVLYGRTLWDKINPNRYSDPGFILPTFEFSSLPTPTTVVTDRQQVLNGFAKIKDSTSVKYSVTGSDGDELSFVREYTVDLEEEKEKSTHDEDSVYSTDAYKYSEYLIDGKFYLQTEDGEVTQSDERRAPYSLDDIEVSLNLYLNAEDYRMTSSRVEKEYNGQPAYYIKLDYTRISDTSSIWSRFKAYADVILEEYSIEAYTNLDGQLLELVIPNVYSQVTYRFLETNQEYDISLPSATM